MAGTVGSALPAEIDRCIDVLVGILERPPGRREGALALRAEITAALFATGEQDAVAMIRSLQALRQWRL